MTTKKCPKISIVVPIFNEEEGIVNFLDQILLPELKKLRKTAEFEVFLVDDGSTDGSLKILQEYVASHPKCRLVALSRNFGKEVALAAGLRYATGDAVISLDADGQHPPKLIPKFIAKWQTGADVVVGVRDHYEEHGAIQKLGSKLFGFLLKKMGNQRTVPGSTDFRLIDRAVITEYNRFTEHHRVTRGLIDWLGFNQAIIKYTPSSRNAGKPSYSLKKLFHLAIDSFVSLSSTPLLICGYIGAFIMIASFLIGAFDFIEQILLGDPLRLDWSGAVQMIIFVTFLVGIILVSQAVTALYIAHIHADAQNRPIFVVNRRASRHLPKDKTKD